MGCLQNKLMDLFLFIKMLLFGSVAMFHEAVDTIKPLKGTSDMLGFSFCNNVFIFLDYFRYGQ